MLVQFENPALIKPQSFPNGIAALDGGIERADAGFVPTNKLTVDVDDQMAVSFVEFLQHEMAKNELGKQEPRKKKFNLRDLRSFLISCFPDYSASYSVQISGARSRCSHGALAPCRMRPDGAGRLQVNRSFPAIDPKRTFDSPYFLLS